MRIEWSVLRSASWHKGGERRVECVGHRRAATRVKVVVGARDTTTVQRTMADRGEAEAEEEEGGDDGNRVGE